MATSSMNACAFFNCTFLSMFKSIICMRTHVHVHVAARGLGESGAFSASTGDRICSFAGERTDLCSFEASPASEHVSARSTTHAFESWVCLHASFCVCSLSICIVAPSLGDISLFVGVFGMQVSRLSCMDPSGESLFFPFLSAFSFSSCFCCHGSSLFACSSLHMGMSRHHRCPRIHRSRVRCHDDDMGPHHCLLVLCSTSIFVHAFSFLVLWCLHAHLLEGVLIEKFETVMEGPFESVHFHRRSIKTEPNHLRRDNTAVRQ